jgi:DNA-binding response OmpR family regulator
VRLLIVEDNWMMAYMIEDVAHILNIEVVGVATSWGEAEKIVALQKPDFAILDINIDGEIDGIKAARLLRAQGIYFLFLTAYKDIDTIEEATELSPLAYLVKPITPENLMATLLLAIKKIDQKLPNKKIFSYSAKNNDVLYQGKAITNLSKSERRVLGLLVKNIGHTVGYESFFYDIDGDLESNNEASLRNIVAKLRKKCPTLVIKNVKDVGYMASSPESE